MTPSPQRRQHLISFRRISLLGSSPHSNRQSTASIVSYQSSPDSANGASTENLHFHLGLRASLAHTDGSSSGVKGAAGKRVGRPVSVEFGKKLVRRKEPLQVDEMKEAKRRKVIVELYETELAYVDGLNLIYSVSDRRLCYRPLL